jgi:hypothetical protein
VVRVPGYRTEMNCASFEVRTEFMYVMQKKPGRLCGLVVRVFGYRSGGPSSIPCTTSKKSSGSRTGSTQPREYNWGATRQESSGSCLENREYGIRDPSRWPRCTLYPQKVGNHFADKRRSLSRYSSLADSHHGVFYWNRVCRVGMISIILRDRLH